MKRLLTIVTAVVAFLFLNTLTVYASPKQIVDEYGLFTAEEINTLEQRAEEISETYGVALYIRIVNGMGGREIQEYAEYRYMDEGMGYGSEQNGYLLTIDMDERYYLTTAYGNKAHIAFTDYAKDQVEAGIEYELRNGDFYRAAERFLNDSEYMLERASQGDPVDVPGVSEAELAIRREKAKRAYRTMTLVGSPLASLLVCLGLKGRNRTKGIAKTASSYIPENGLTIHRHDDIFLYRNVTRTPIPRNTGSGGGHSGGGTTINSGGFSHGSGGRF